MASLVLPKLVRCWMLGCLRQSVEATYWDGAARGRAYALSGGGKTLLTQHSPRRQAPQAWIRVRPGSGAGSTFACNHAATVRLGDGLTTSAALGTAQSAGQSVG